MDASPSDSPFLPYLPTFFQQLRTIDQQNPDKWPDPEGSQEQLVNFHKLRLSGYTNNLSYQLTFLLYSFLRHYTCTAEPKQTLQFSSCGVDSKLPRKYSPCP